MKTNRTRICRMLPGLGLLPATAVAEDVFPFPDPRTGGEVGSTMQESVHKWREEPRRLPEDAPNILIVMFDDAGFGQPDTFGGEIHTPTLFRLAEEGIACNRFHTTAMCSPTRAALLTGRNHHRVGVGSPHAVPCLDADGDDLDGSETYSLTLPPGIPAKDFWCFVNHDPQTRSLLRTPSTPFPSVSSQSGAVQANADGSTTIWFGLEPPDGKEPNWVQTVTGKGWFTVLRLHGPLEPRFRQTWRPGDIELARRTPQDSGAEE